MKKLSIQSQYLVLCLILLTSAAYIGLTNYYVLKYAKGHISNVVRDIHSTCLIDCENAAGMCAASFHGHNHSRMDAADIQKYENCFMTFWGGTHFAMWSVVGFFCPDLFCASFVIGVGFECFEALTYKFYDKASLNYDTMDVFFNTVGFFTGCALGDYFR